MRNIFDQYTQPENRLTHSFVSCLYEDKKLVRSFIKKFCPKFFNKKSILTIDQQTLPGIGTLKTDEKQKKGLPDAIIYSEDRCLIIESKISSSLTRNQLLRHENTIKKKGIDKILGISITVDLIKNINLNNWIHLTWNQIYNWVYNETENSKWAKRLLEYFNVAENKMVEDEYLTEGSITEFTGINFNENNPYSYLEAKRLLKLLIKKVRQNKILGKELNADLYGKGRGGIKKGNVWDYLTFKYSPKVMYFTDEPHLTIGFTEKHVAGDLTIPYGIKGRTKKNFYNLSWDEFKKIIYRIAQNYRDYFGNSEGFQPRIVVAQRRYPNQSSPAIDDGRIDFDIRTAFEDLSSQLKPTQKKQEEWLRAVFELNNNKKSNMQFQIGACFYFNKYTLVNKKDADMVICKSFLACKPLIKYLYK